MAWKIKASFSFPGGRSAIAATLFASLISPAAKAQNVNAPTWSSVMMTGQEVQYFKYSNGSGTEVATSLGFGGSSTATQLSSTSRPPAYYSINGGTGATRSTCALLDNPSKPLYWYGDGTHSAVKFSSTSPLLFPKAPSDEYNVSRLERNLKGLEFLGSFLGSGSVSGSGAYIVESVFYSDRPCTDGGLEYGFYRRLIAGGSDEIAFYYSDFTNCDGGVCRATDSSSGAIEYPNVRTHSISSLALNSHSENKYYFHAYPVYNGESYDMRFEVLDPYTFAYAQCKVDGSSTVSDCYRQYGPSDGTIPFSVFYNATGYLFATAQSVGTVSASTAFQLYVDRINVGQ